jgi:hypothetical protein
VERVSGKTYTGNPPTDGELLARTTQWELYQRNSSGAWVNLKLCAIGRRTHKANYWLAYDTTQQRLASNTDEQALLQHASDTHAWVLATCKDTL